MLDIIVPFIIDKAQLIWNMRGYLVFFTMIFLGLNFKKSKYISILMCLYYWALIGLNTWSADYYSYEEMYYCSFEPRYLTHEIGFMFLCRLFLTLGLSYTIFRTIIAFIIVYFTYKGLKYYTPRINYVMAIYLIFSFLGSVSGLRFACATAIFIYISRYLFTKTKYSNLKYLFGIGCSMLFHYSFIFFCIFLIAKYKKLKNIPMLFQSLIITLAIFMLARLGILFRLVTYFTFRDKTIMWLNTTSYFSPLYAVSICLFMVFLWFMYNAKIIEQKRELIDEFQCINMKSEDMALASRIVILSLVAFSGAMFNSIVYLRLLMPMLPIGYAVCINSFIVYKKEKNLFNSNIKNYRLMFFMFVLLVASFVYGYWIGGSTYSLAVNNMLFN